MNRDDLQKLSLMRLREAEVLLNAGEFSGAYYLAGYVVECALKACIARRTQQYDFPDKQRATDSYVHDLRKLARVAGLDDLLRSTLDHDREFEEDWSVLLAWSESSRYNSYDETKARTMLISVGDEQRGVLRWIMQYW